MKKELEKLKTEAVSTLEDVREQYNRIFSDVFKVLKVKSILLDKPICLESKGTVIKVVSLEKEEEKIFIVSEEKDIFELRNVACLEKQCELIQVICEVA